MPPAEGQLLVNTETSFDEYSHSESTGVVIRDNHGGVIAASNKFLPHVADAHMAEAWALHDVCAWLKALVQTKLYVKLIALKWRQRCKKGVSRLPRLRQSMMNA